MAAPTSPTGTPAPSQPRAPSQPPGQQGWGDTGAVGRGRVTELTGICGFGVLPELSLGLPSTAPAWQESPGRDTEGEVTWPNTGASWLGPSYLKANPTEPRKAPKLGWQQSCAFPLEQSSSSPHAGMLQVGTALSDPPSAPQPWQKTQHRTELVGAARTCFPSLSPQARVPSDQTNSLLKMKQNVSIPSWVISSRKAEEQRGRSLIKRFRVLLAAFARGVVSLSWEGGRNWGSGDVGRAKLCPAQPSLSPPEHLGVQGMLVKMPPWGHLCCDIGGCLSGDSFDVKSPN